MGAYGRITPALPLKELNRSLFITADFGQVLDHVRFRKLRMFLTIHGSIFHDEVGHWLGNPRTKVKICVIYILPKTFDFSPTFPGFAALFLLYAAVIMRMKDDVPRRRIS